ncbi:serine/threonine-protein kinase Nek2-like isoform X1 [Syngnathoides biaculeatus]|uniref:serine/threonine-protein kinase Nek2-like isoform X1 n=1 Tax=Syngnathoides biaculeatus TaxID=300417 RepID=UPI002ADDF24A|nr:serine/threonine-protein kinase Nek2-like isoform X1 [Syngnathoides biaculeatus]
MTSRRGEYDVLYSLSVDSYGRCQKIRRKCDGKVMVWKEIFYGTLTESETQRLMSEVKCRKKLKHPNILRCYDWIVDSANTKLYMVMEDCQGDTLASLITSTSRERRHLDEQFILRVLAQLSSVLKFQRTRKSRPASFLHHNLKPENIFLDSEQNVMLGTCSYIPTVSAFTFFTQWFVWTMALLNCFDHSLVFTSILQEQRNKMSFNDKCDVWSLGCLLYELCTLCRYFPAQEQRVLAEKMPAATFIRIPGLYSEELGILLNNMLNLTGSLRPSVESIFQSNLLAEAVGEETKKTQLWLQRRLKRIELNKKLRCVRKNKENLSPIDPQFVMLHKIARRLRTDSQHASQVDKEPVGVCSLRL